MKVIILAAGKGTRMNSDQPKVLLELQGKPLIHHVVDTVIESGIDPEPVVVVGYKSDLVKESLKEYSVSFVHQEEQLGTGHAVSVCAGEVNKYEDLIVLYGDCPFISKDTLHRLMESFSDDEVIMSLATVSIPDFSACENAFTSFGRILRNEYGGLLGIREAKDATEDELAITEVNPAFYAFSGTWLWRHIEGLEQSNAQQEFYLTDLLEKAINLGERVDDIAVSHIHEGIGINTPEQLRFANNLFISIGAT